MSWHENEVRKIADVSCRKFGHRIYVVKINRGAVIGKAVSPYGAYVRAYQFLRTTLPPPEAEQTMRRG
jgi:hypothetical protein